MKTEAIAQLMTALEAEQHARTSTFNAAMEVLGRLLPEPHPGKKGSGAVSVMRTRPRVSMSEKVRRTIEGIHEPFDVQGVVDELVRQAKGKADEGTPERLRHIEHSEPIRRIISNEINKLRHAKKLEVVKAGSGSKGGVYRRVIGTYR